MELREARDVLLNCRPVDDRTLGEAIGVVLARLDEIESRARQVRGGLKPYARPVEVVDFLLAEPGEA
jgi:hypothetical protein